EQVERVEGEVLAAGLLERRLEQLEVGLALVIERHGLAIDQATSGKVRGGLHQGAELVAPVLAVSGPCGRGARAGGDEQPVAVIFIFEEPLRSGRNLVDQRRKLRLPERRRRLSGLFPRASAFLA